MTGSISAAVEALRTSREAVQAHQATAILSEGVMAESLRFGVWFPSHVVQALEELLRVIARADYDNPSSTIEHIEDAAEALALITLPKETAP